MIPLEKLSWGDLSAPTKVRILVSEYVHLGKLGVIEDWVGRRQVRALEEELARRGGIWDLNRDPTGSEHLYIESAALHVDTYFRANKAKLGALRLLQGETSLISPKCSACADANEPHAPQARPTRLTKNRTRPKVYSSSPPHNHLRSSSVIRASETVMLPPAHATTRC
jgi:hypothetical protein